MSLMRQQSGNEIVMHRPSTAVFNAFRKAGAAAGAVKEDHASMGTMLVRLPMQLLPLRNPCTVRVSVESIESGRSRVKFRSYALDGVIGIGSSVAAIDELTAAAKVALAGGTPQKRFQHNGLLLLLAVTLPVLVWLIYMFSSVTF